MIYVIQEHHARHLHWDLRLEYNGVLKSWAIPKLPSPSFRRLAVEVEDHPLGYEKFEGVIPEGQYGAGTVKIWDSGSYEIIEKKKDLWRIKINGKKLKGTWNLIRIGDKNWLFFKSKS